MTEGTERLWWPLPMEPVENQSEETKAKIAFLDQAIHQGLRAFVEQSDCGAIADDGRECALIWRGKQRCELLLIVDGEVMSKRLLTDPSEASAFRQASNAALLWLGPNQAQSSVANGDPASQMTTSRAIQETQPPTPSVAPTF